MVRMRWVNGNGAEGGKSGKSDEEIERREMHEAKLFI